MIGSPVTSDVSCVDAGCPQSYPNTTKFPALRTRTCLQLQHSCSTGFCAALVSGIAGSLADRRGRYLRTYPYALDLFLAARRIARQRLVQRDALAHPVLDELAV